MTPRIANPAQLHLCIMPSGYVAPRALFKLFYEAVLFSTSRSCAIDFFGRLLRRTRVICGRCGTRIDITLWSQTEINRLYVLGRRADGRQLQERMQRDYVERTPTCPACGRTTHLAHIHLPFFEDVAIVSPAPDPADDVQAART